MQVWGDRCCGIDQGLAARAWISSLLGVSARLVRVPETPNRLANSAYAGLAPPPLTFADGFQILVCNSASLDELNTRCQVTPGNAYLAQQRPARALFLRYPFERRLHDRPGCRYQIFGLRPRRTFREAATKYLRDFAHKPGIGRAATALKDMDKFIGDKCIDQIHNETFKPYIDARRRVNALLEDPSVLRAAHRAPAGYGRVRCQHRTARSGIARPEMGHAIIVSREARVAPTRSRAARHRRCARAASRIAQSRRMSCCAESLAPASQSPARPASDQRVQWA